jgi:protein-tyrosine phosphatase
MTLNNFSWIIPDRLAGSDIPGRGTDVIESLNIDIGELSQKHIQCLVSLQMPHESIETVCKRFGITWKYFPVPDFGVPQNSADFKILVEEIVMMLKNDSSVCVHCHAGIGRTGLALACIVGTYFAIDGKKAISTVRKTRSALDTNEQEQFVISFLGEYEY